MLRSDYLTHFCQKCMHVTDHVRLTYFKYITLTCMICQNDIQFDVSDITVKKTYTIVSIYEKDRSSLSGKKRTVVVEIIRKSEPDKLAETETIVETFMVQYPAYGVDHFTASVEQHPNDGPLNFVEARAISEEIKKLIK